MNNNNCLEQSSKNNSHDKYPSVSNLADLPQGVSNEIIKEISSDRLLAIIKSINKNAEINPKWNRAATFHLNNVVFGDPQLKFDSKNGVFSCGVYIATTMKKAKRFYTQFYSMGLDHSTIQAIKLHPNFHLQDAFGNHLEESYHCSLNIDDYIAFWEQKEHISLLHQIKGKNELQSFLQSLANEGGLTTDDVQKIYTSEKSTKRTTYNVIPELCASKTWTIEEAKKTDLDGHFAQKVKEFINLVLQSFNQPTI